MTRKLSMLGLALVAALALSVLEAAVAPAQTLHSESASGTTYLTLDQKGPITLATPAGSITCGSVTGEASYSGTTASEVTIAGFAYDSCEFLGAEIDWDMRNCVYTLTASTGTAGVVHISCPTTAGGVTDTATLTLTVSGTQGCHYEISEQTFNVGIANGGATEGAGIPKDIAMTQEAKDAITYHSERTGVNGVCPAGKVHFDGIIVKGSTTFTAFEDAAHTKRVGLTYT